MKKRIISLLLLVLLIIIPIKAHANNLLSKLEVEGIGELSVASKSVWNLQLTTSLSYANIIATPASEAVKVEGAGKVEVKEGANAIVVTASDGTNTETYTINLNVIKDNSIGSGANDSGDPIKNPNTGNLLTTETIILAVVATIVMTSVIISKKKIFKIN